MVLGVYWYFDFPEGLYSYDYFKFNKGLGGHADNPAELLADVHVQDVDSLIDDLKIRIHQYKDAFVFVYKSVNGIQIGTGGYAMHDYDFELALKIEQVLKEHQAESVSNLVLKGAELIRITNDSHPTINRISKKYFQLVGSSLKKYNAETSSIRFDCNVHEAEKEFFLNAIKAVTETVHIDVVFYMEKKYTDRYNLMLFFTNGRQGIGLVPEKHVPVADFENAMDALIITYNVQIGHIGGWDNYPKGAYIVLKIVDEAFIL